LSQPNSIRETLLEAAIRNKGYLADRIQITFSGRQGMYTEILNEKEFQVLSESTSEFSGMSPLQMAQTLVKTRITDLLEMKGYEITEDIDFESSDFYDGYEINVPFKKKKEQFNEDSFFTELDQMFNRQVQIREKSAFGDKEQPENPGPRSLMGGKPRPIKNKAGDTPLNQEPDHADTHHLPTRAKKEKTQNPRKVDLLLKTVFEGKFNNYVLQTDIGGWKPVKALKEDGKLVLTWENMDVSKIKIETLLFPHDTNKIKIQVFSGQQVEIDYFFEVYRIPTDAFLVEKFFRKTFFNLLKKFIETRVIQIEPFNLQFVFWKTDNPFFSYSFSSPKKNKIVKDLIAFISTAKKPILDDFFEQNNLKHKQGYLQTLLDSAEAAGIFKFAREGNEIVILKGPNYKAFLDGKIRRVAS
jgi:hypothetical protein